MATTSRSIDAQRKKLPILQRLYPPNENDGVAFSKSLFFKRRHMGRIIGLPGETLELVKSWIKIDGEALVEPYVAHKQNYDHAPTEIPLGHFFIAGDNRLMHFSKYHGGLIKKENIKGICTSVSKIGLKLFTPEEMESEPLMLEEERSPANPEVDEVSGNK